MVMPTVTFEGSLTRDPLRVEGVPAVTMRLVANDRKRGQDGKWYDADSFYIDVTCWRQLAENVIASLRKGDRVIAVGTLRQREYEKDGTTRQVVEIDATNVGVGLLFVTTEVKRVERAPRPEAPAGDKPW